MTSTHHKGRITNTAFTVDTVFTNVPAQDFAFDLLSRGSEALHEALAETPRNDAGQCQRVLAACELVASANGHPSAPSGWCRMMESWLVKRQFAPAPATVELAAQHVTQ